ncbi:acyl-CoA thioesterase [Yunchengibacter salinarum]|uniref:acyl-CoA thioesterase n=1 Tax=Yunchengibacter salinarum TaxID=3133399 RepID=UPI0035B6A828
MNQMQTFLTGLGVERLDRLLFRGEPNKWQGGHVYGGHVVAQALEAAGLTVDAPYRLHAMHSYFLRPGRSDMPILYDVEAMRDGRSFATRRVVAVQDGKSIFSAAFNYHVPEDGLSHQIDMPDVPPPEDLGDDETYYARILRHLAAKTGKSQERPYLPFEMRSVDRMDVENLTPKDPVCGYWLKLKEPLAADGALHARLLAYISDFNFLSANLRPHGMVPRHPRLKTLASLDHAMWFHAHDISLNDWVYYKTEGYWTGDARGLARGAIYSRAGTLIASTAQESLLRLKDPDNTTPEGADQAQGGPS